MSLGLQHLTATFKENGLWATVPDSPRKEDWVLWAKVPGSPLVKDRALWASVPDSPHDRPLWVSVPGSPLKEDFGPLGYITSQSPGKGLGPVG